MANKEKAPAARPGLGWVSCITGVTRDDSDGNGPPWATHWWTAYGLFFRFETVRVLGGQRSTPPGTTIAAYMTSRPDFGERWPARLVATAAEDRLNISAKVE